MRFVIRVGNAPAKRLQGSWFERGVCRYPGGSALTSYTGVWLDPQRFSPRYKLPELPYIRAWRGHCLGSGMSSTLAPDFSLPPLSRAPNGDGLSKASLRAAREEIHWLSVDLSAVPEGVRAALRVSSDEIAAWSALSARFGASLVVITTESTIELCSTEHDRRHAFRGAMESFAARVQLRHELGRSRTVERRGGAAVRHLFQRAAGTAVGGGRAFLARMHAATATASSHAVLGPTLASMFRVAANVGLRVRVEATAGASPNQLGELETMVAERIVEEELAAWQAQEAELGRVEDLNEVFLIEGESEDACEPRVFAEEPGSHVRIRAADYLVGLGDVVPISLRAAGQRK